MLQTTPKRSKEEQVSSPLTTVHNSNKTYAKLMRDMKVMMRIFEKERKIRELLEDLCIQQSNEIEDNKVEIRELRNLCTRLQRQAAEDHRRFRIKVVEARRRGVDDR